MGKGMDKKTFGHTFPEMVLTATFGGITAAMPWQDTEMNRDLAKARVRELILDTKDLSHPNAQVNMAVAETYLAAFGY